MAPGARHRKLREELYTFLSFKKKSRLKPASLAFKATMFKKFLLVFLKVLDVGFEIVERPLL